MSIPKHEAPAPRKGTKKSQPAAISAPAAPAVIVDVDLSGIEVALDNFARAFRSYATNASNGDNAVALYTDPSEHAHPMRLQLEGEPVQVTLADNDYSDTMGRLVTAVERIADSLGKLAGLNRPRLEDWHEQDEYEPRYKSVAADGGAPGPKKAA